jgi:hypothetical protein
MTYELEANLPHGPTDMSIIYQHKLRTIIIMHTNYSFKQRNIHGRICDQFIMLHADAVTAKT